MRTAIPLLALALLSCAPQESAEKNDADPQTTSGVRFTDSPSLQRDAAWSPDGKWIAYAAASGFVLNSDEDIWKQPVDGGDPIQITSGPDADGYPSWSPDGKWISFVSNRDGTNNFWIVSADGGTPWQLTTPIDSLRVAKDGGTTSWSPDGKWITFGAERDGNYDIWAIPSAGGKVRRITTNPARDLFPSWSPDGEWIAFSSMRMENIDIWVISAAGGDARQVTQTGADWVPSWSPDGKWIAFQSTREGKTQDIWIIPTEGGRARRAFSLPEVNVAVARWSPDGTRIACNGGLPTFDVWRMPAAGGEPTHVTRLRGQQSAPRASWSPDGMHIVFVEEDGQERDIWRMELESGNRQRITEEGAGGWRGTPAWSPDGQRVSYTGADNHIWTVPAEGGRSRQLTVSPGEQTTSAWSPDGQRIAYTASSNGVSGWDIWTIPARGGTAEKLVDWLTGEYEPDWSPDGRHIAFTSLRQPPGMEDKGLQLHIWVAPVDEGERAYLTEGSFPSWSPDGTELVFVSNSNDIWKIPAAGGEAVCLLETDYEEWEPSWSPDGSQILFVSITAASDIWIADVSGVITEE
jgi:TolB protein